MTFFVARGLWYNAIAVISSVTVINLYVVCDSVFIITLDTVCPDEETGQLDFGGIFICLVQSICDSVCDGDKLYMLSVTTFLS